MKIKLFENGKIPTYAHKSDACCDCYANVGSAPFIIKPMETKKIPLGFAIQLENEMEAVIRPRSGLSLKGILAHIGTIDSGYTGEVAAIITNLSGKNFTVTTGDKICQMKIQKANQHSFEEVDALEETDRGDNGFGSTGL